MYLVPLFFQIFYSLVPKIEIFFHVLFGQKFPKLAIVGVLLYFLVVRQSADCTGIS